MKVKFKYGIRTFSGTVDEMTYGSYKDDQLCIGRRWVLPEATPQNTTLGSVSKNLADLWQQADAAYKADFKTYARRYGKEVCKPWMLPPTGYSLWVKAMYAWAEDEDPDLDLSSLTFEDVETLGSKVASVSACVQNNYLPSVSAVDELDASI